MNIQTTKIKLKIIYRLQKRNSRNESECVVLEKNTLQLTFLCTLITKQMTHKKLRSKEKVRTKESIIMKEQMKKKLAL